MQSKNRCAVSYKTYNIIRKKCLFRQLIPWTEWARFVQRAAYFGTSIYFMTIVLLQPWHTFIQSFMLYFFFIASEIGSSLLILSSRQIWHWIFEKSIASCFSEKNKWVFLEKFNNNAHLLKMFESIYGNMTFRKSLSPSINSIWRLWNFWNNFL